MIIIRGGRERELNKMKKERRNNVDKEIKKGWIQTTKLSLVIEGVNL